MKDLKRILATAVMMLCIVPVGAFAQRGQKPPPPPKVDTPKVVVAPKQEPPPNNNEGRGQKKRGDRRGKP